MADTYDFEIYLFGLICVHGASPEKNAPSRKTRAVLLTDNDHTPLLYLNNGSDTTEYTLTDHITFRNLQTAEATILPTFDTFVPHLAQLTKPSVKLNLEAPGIRVTFPGGLLATVNFYTHQGKYVLDATEPYSGCIGRITLLQVSTSREEVVVHFNSSTEQNVPAKKGWVLIANADHTATVDPEVDTGERPAFKKYHKATLGVPGDLATLYELIDAPCNSFAINPPNIKAVHLDEVLKIVDPFKISLHPECSNTQWP